MFLLNSRNHRNETAAGPWGSYAVDHQGNCQVENKDHAVMMQQLAGFSLVREISDYQQNYQEQQYNQTVETPLDVIKKLGLTSDDLRQIADAMENITCDVPAMECVPESYQVPINPLNEMQNSINIQGSNSVPNEAKLLRQDPPTDMTVGGNQLVEKKIHQLPTVAESQVNNFPEPKLFKQDIQNKVETRVDNSSDKTVYKLPDTVPPNPKTKQQKTGLETLTHDQLQKVAGQLNIATDPNATNDQLRDQITSSVAQGV